MTLCKLTNPANSDSYTFEVNPTFDAETKGGGSFQQKQRQIERTSNTGNVGLTKQQGEDGAYIIHWEFPVFKESMERALWTWWQLCKTQSIYLTDFAGDEYEGQIITLGRQRAGAIAGPQDVNRRKFSSNFIFEFEVWRFISGILADAGVTP